MSKIVEILLWAPTREIFAATLTNLTLPNGQHIAFLPPEGETGPEDGSIITIDTILCSEIGEVTKVPAVLDEEGNTITPAVTIPGYHVNMVATGWLAEMLTAGLPTEGTLFERTRILSLLGEMNWQPSEVGEPEGYVGTSGVKIFDPNVINNRARIWNLPDI